MSELLTILPAWKPVLNVVIHTTPVAQPRGRVGVIKQKNGKVRGTIFNQTTIKNSDGTKKPHPIVAFKSDVKRTIAQHWKGAPLEGPLRLDLVFVFPRPKKLIWKTKPMPRLRYSIKPDRDNIDKSLMDAVKGIVWIDDAQVCDGRIQKFYAAGDETPFVEFKLFREVE